MFGSQSYTCSTRSFLISVISFGFYCTVFSLYFGLHSFEFSTQNSIYIENNILMSKMYEISFQVRVEHVHDTPEAAENFLYETLGSSLLHHRSRFLGHKRTKNLISLQLACHLRRFLGLFGLSWDKSWAFHPSLNLIVDIEITKSYINFVGLKCSPFRR